MQMYFSHYSLLGALLKNSRIPCKQSVIALSLSVWLIISWGGAVMSYVDNAVYWAYHS